MKRLVVHMMVM
jgi:hypothetical protein